MHKNVLPLLLVGLLSLASSACGPEPRPETDGGSCAAGKTYCGEDVSGVDICVDIMSDPRYCGSCINACQSMDANACVGGLCACVGANHNISDACGDATEDGPTVCIADTGQCIVPDYGTTETCDTIDNRPCKDPQKVCAGGWCTLPNCGALEECNFKDDDCDGHVDATGPLPGPDMPLKSQCYEGNLAEVGVGICRAGEQSCFYGNWTPINQCPGQVLPSPEDGLLACDGLDNDCNACVDDRLDENGMLVCDMNDPKTTDVIFMIDVSGSMSGILSAVITASGNFAATYSNAAHIRWGIERIAVVDPTYVDVFHPLSAFASFLTKLGMLAITGGTEPTYDAVYVTATGGYDAALLNGSMPGEVQIYVVFGDENAQTLMGLTETQVCQAVAARGAILVVFANPAFYAEWDECAILYPLTSDAGQMTMQLDQLFDLTCTF